MEESVFSVFLFLSLAHKHTYTFNVYVRQIILYKKDIDSPDFQVPVEFACAGSLFDDCSCVTAWQIINARKSIRENAANFDENRFSELDFS